MCSSSREDHERSVYRWSHAITALLALWVIITFAGYVKGELSFELSVISLLTFLAVKA